MTVAASLPADADTHEGLPNPIRFFAFLTLALGIIMAVLDGTIVNVALPTIALDQHASAADAIWIVTGYQLAVTISLLPLSALGEAIGFKKVFLVGLVLFSAASFLCANSPSLLVLTIARIIQGVGGAALMGVNGALVRFIMPQRMLGRGIASVAMVVAVSGAAGPTIAAAILAVTTWHWLFLINVPLGIITFFAGRITLPATPKSGVKFDFGSALFNAGAFGFLISGLASIGTTGVSPWVPGLQLAIAAVSGVFLFRRQTHRASPMLPVDLLRIPPFRLAIVASITSFVAQFLATVSLPFFFNRVLGFNAVETGLLMTPWPVATALIAPVAGRLADRYRAGPLCGMGSLLFAMGLTAIAVLPAHPAVWDIVWRVALTGLGFGLFQSPNNRVMFTTAPRRRSGGASGMQSTARLLGQSTGAALAAIIFGVTATYNLPLTMGIAAAFAFIAAVSSVWR